MTASTDSWSNTHDLALIFIALAYGTDRILADEELQAIIDAVQRWQVDWTADKVQEVVMEALAVYLDGSADEITRSINRLKTSLDAKGRQRALEDVVRVAEADGIVLGSERSLISILARAWDVKEVSDNEAADSDEGWGILHDVGLMYVSIAHGGDAELSGAEIQAMITRLVQWQPELMEEGARKVLREALQFYSTQPDSEAFSESVVNIKQAFPIPQRVAVLDDLVFIAEADGSVSAHEEEMIKSLSKAWDVGVQLNTSLTG